MERPESTSPPPPPIPLRPCFKNLPAELKALTQWVLWRYVWREDARKPGGGAWTKVLYNPHTGREADSTEPATWGTFEEAVAAYGPPPPRPPRWAGVGFVFSPDDPYTGVDFDDCLDPETGEVTAEVAAWLARYDTYTEVSPSGTGVKLILRGVKPGTRCRVGDTKMYDRSRFFTLTGHVFEFRRGGAQ